MSVVAWLVVSQPDPRRVCTAAVQAWRQPFLAAGSGASATTQQGAGRHAEQRPESASAAVQVIATVSRTPYEPALPEKAAAGATVSIWAA